MSIVLRREAGIHQVTFDMGPVLKATIIEAFVGIIDDKVYTTEVVGGFDDIVDIDTLIGDANGVGLEDVARLVMGETTALDMV